MAIETAADRAVFLNPDEFGEAVSWTVGATTVSVAGLAIASALQVDGQDTPGVMLSQAAFKLAGEDVPSGAGEGNAVTFRGVAHTVRSIEPDGTGMTLVRLERVDS